MLEINANSSSSTITSANSASNEYASVTTEVEITAHEKYDTEIIKGLGPIVWRKVIEGIKEVSNECDMNHNKTNLTPLKEQMMCLTQAQLRYVIDNAAAAQDPEGCRFQPPKARKHQAENELFPTSKGNKTGCARTEPFGGQSPFNMFSWMLSKHRKLPSVLLSNEDMRTEYNCPKTLMPPSPEELDKSKINEELAQRQSTVLSLPRPMQFSQLPKKVKEHLLLYASKIHGLGIYCKKAIAKGEMVIEFAGEVIRKSLTDKREKMYQARGIGCYLFRLDKDVVIDSTLKANAARFINHSCEPNCVSRNIQVLGSRHIVIFALRNIYPGEELTYDYKFQRESIEEKLTCNCGSKKCRKYMN